MPKKAIDKPYNELPPLPPDFNFDDVEILKMVNTANLALSNLNGLSKSLPNRMWLIAPLSVKEAVDSSGVENINTTVADVFEAELFPEKEEIGARKETLNYKNALLKGYELVTKKGFINTNLIIEIQKELEPNKAGIRKIPNTKIQSGYGENTKTIYYPPEGYEVILDKLKNLEDYINQEDEDFPNQIDPLIKMAIIHYQFESIHPFLDGNGRTGRILMVLYLVLKQRLDVPILFLSNYILKNRAGYYQVLNDVTFEQDWKSLILYFLYAITTQATQTNAVVLKIQIQIEKFKKVLSEKNPKLLNSDFVDTIFASPMITYESLSKDMKIHKNTASKYLNELVKFGLLERMKYKKEVVFVNQKYLAILNSPFEEKSEMTN
jgi:Fic family protein